ncbi:dihydrofolate synthase / folylpolyglutamate synthase [Cryptosporangium aurantiacum]|uniref:tetrahydrofolate synthase n=2 Tax=Cryptosporangium aurantiacum TaxID=134849 RepID=A0A1M7Q7S9_9ACTN|nr:folylpolyglutamate synthase/dihydrofolate synthase family protein [Cryptosporangium aurantiacum]SHN26369.1 dihydrofolate synthase / folylpolyglutamate synthase [Cryptosporangium aurantiacum]
MSKDRAADQRAAEEAAELARAEAGLNARGPGRMVPDRERIVALLDLLGNPQRAYPAIHLTGTNGKTSTSRMIDSLLKAFGLRAGRYTSPHLESVTERISLDGDPIPAGKFAAAYDEVAPMADLLDAKNSASQAGGDPVTYFEFTTAMAFAAFADAPVDVAVVEVGLGGEWDATNVLEAGVAVVTPISLDHAALLGGSVTSIATEKAGIIHEGASVITAVQPAEAIEPLVSRAASVGASVAREGVEFGVLDRAIAVGGQQLRLKGLAGEYDEIFLPLYGAHQAQNAVLALAAVEAFLGAAPGRPLAADAVRDGFAAVRSPGRLERLRTSPTVLVDAAHNPAGMTATVQAMAEAFAFRKLVAVVAVLDDKDYRGMLELLEPVADAIVVTENSSPRRLPVDALAAVAVDVFGADRVDVASRLDDAIESAVTIAEEDDGGDAPLAGAGVLVTGSVVTAADARRLLAR